MKARSIVSLIVCGLVLIFNVGALTEQEALERGRTFTSEQERQLGQKINSSGVVDTKRAPLPSTLLSENTEFDVEAKTQSVIDLVERGSRFMQDNDLDIAFNLFTHGKDFIKGELYLFVYDMDHVCFAHGQEADLVWQDFSNLKDIFGTYIVRSFVDTAQLGGGWVTYQWRNATKKSYVKKITKGSKSFVIGAGFYPHSKRDAVVSLVKGAASYFKESMERGLGVDDVFSTLSYPFGRFVVGDLYLYAVRFDGTMMANGDRPGLIGFNVLNNKDSQGTFINKEIIAGLKANPEGIWIDYLSKNAPKLAYAEQIIDLQGTKYFIACGYYPDADRRKLITLVKDGYEFMKKNGLTTAAEEFTSRTKNDFRYGDLYLMIYTLDGVCVAHGKNPDFVGTNQMDLQDEDGRYFVKEMISKAKQGGNWVDFKLKNAFQAVYVEPIDLGVQSYIIASSFYPVSKRETALLLVRSGTGVMRTSPNKDAFSQFGNKKGTFIRGDLGVFVMDFKGICRVYGDTYDLIWRNLMGARDDNGKEYVKLFINTARQGSGQVTYTINGIKRIAFVEKVTKDGTDYVVGSGYFL